MSNFNFDEWAELYRTDPRAFDKKRREATDAAIASAPEHLRAKLRETQTQCDAIHTTQPGREGASRMFAMMHDSLLDMQNAWYDLAFAHRELAAVAK